jgi:hypothetical protein
MGVSELLKHVFTPEIVAAFETLVDRRVEQRLAELGREDLVPCAEMAGRLGCTPAALRERARRGTVPSHLHGRRRYFKPSEVFGVIERGLR